MFLKAPDIHCYTDYQKSCYRLHLGGRETKTYGNYWVCQKIFDSNSLKIIMPFILNTQKRNGCGLLYTNHYLLCFYSGNIVLTQFSISISL